MMSAALLAMAALGFTACTTSKNAQKDNSKPSAGSVDNGVATFPSDDMDPSFGILSDDQRKIIDGNNAFAIRLFEKIQGMDSEVVSPLSVAYLMGMLANGADGNTQQEILKAIGCEGMSVKQLNELYRGLIEMAGRRDKQTVVSIANYVAVNKNYQLNDTFVKNVGESYHAGVESLDFSSHTTTDKINGWCKEQTKGMIPRIIDQVEPSAVSYLMNAIYFNGAWTNKFDANDTKLENFRGYTRDIQKVDMMHQNKKFYYGEMDGFKAVELPYGNRTYSMTVLLPNEDSSISDMMRGLDAEKLNKLSQNMENSIVDLKLPKFTTEMELPLNGIISSLGAPSMFVAGQANFSKFANGDFFVSKMLQKAKIEVSEQGTKAAAVTAAVMLTAAAPMELRHVAFHANRPFVYIIKDNHTGAILFMGQYTGIH